MSDSGRAGGTPEAIVLSIGDEVLRGEVVNANAAWLGAELSARGFRVVRHLGVADREGEIVAALAECAAAAALTIATGGLGPTGDDLTAAAAARWAGAELVEDASVLAAIAARTGRPAGELDADRRRQALVPAGAAALPNPLGTAPGIHLDRGGRHVILLPGVPAEMRAIYAQSAGPLVERLFPDRPRRAALLLHLAAVPEREADALARAELAGPLGAGRLELGTVLGRGGVTLRLCAPGPEGPGLLAGARERLAGVFGERLWGEGAATVEEAAAGELLRRGLRLALAESCTGGLLAARLVGVPGVSAALSEALVVYSNEAKQRLLGVDPGIIARHGAVSPECARACAEGLRARSGADITLAVTGIAGPEGGGPDKPVGTVDFAVASPAGTLLERQRFPGGREWVRERAAAFGLWLIWRQARRT